MEFTTEFVNEVSNELREAKSLKELYLLVDVARTTSPEIVVTDDFKRVFDEVESNLSVGEVTPPDFSGETLLEQMRAVKSQQPRVAKVPRTKIRDYVRFAVNKHVRPWTLPPQAQAIVVGILETGKELITESEMYDLVVRLRAEGKLGGGQPPMHVFRYYLTCKNSPEGFKERQFLTQLG